MTPTYDLLVSISLWFQSLGAWLFPIMKGITVLGNEEFYLLILPALYWCISQPIGLQIGIMVLVSSGINFHLKLAFHSPRPYWVSQDVKNIVSNTSFGFPSGHAQNAASIWGLMAVKMRRGWIKSLFALLIILIGISRLVLGVHFIHDVIGGWIIGGVILGLFILLNKPLSTMFMNMSFRIRTAATFLISLGMILIALLFASPLMNYNIPEVWINNVGGSFHPLNLEGIFTISGVFFGLLSGVYLLQEEGGYSAAGTLWKRILRYPVGLIGVLVLYLGLDFLFPQEASSLSMTLRYFRYLLIGIWISYGAPRVFFETGLATQKQGPPDHDKSSTRK